MKTKKDGELRGQILFTGVLFEALLMAPPPQPRLDHTDFRRNDLVYSKAAAKGDKKETKSQGALLYN